jgi:DNA ligase-1
MGWRDTGSSGEKDQVKLKLEFVVELRIKKLLPASPGTKHEATFGSLLCASECGGVEVGVSGMTDAMRFIISNDPRRFLESIVSVKANDIMYPEDGEDKHSLFLPIFMNLREEKSSADSLTEIIEQRQATLEAA